MKTKLTIESCSELPMQYNAENELHKASRDGSTKEIEKIIKANPHLINIPDGKLGWTPLYRVTLCEFEDAVAVLLRYKADPNIGNSLGETPLHQAADNGNFRIVQLLLEHRADPNAQQSDGNTPLHLACFKGHTEIAEALLAFGANPCIPNTAAGRTPLHVAADGCYDDIMKVLLHYGGGMVLVRDHFGKTALDYSQTKEMRSLLENIKDENKENLSGTEGLNREALFRSTAGCIRCEDNMGMDSPRLTLSAAGKGKSEIGTESFDEYLKRVKDKDMKNSLYQFYEDQSKSPLQDEEERNDYPVPFGLGDRGMREFHPHLDTLREEASHLEATGNAQTIMEEVKQATEQNEEGDSLFESDIQSSHLDQTQPREELTKQKSISVDNYLTENPNETATVDTNMNYTGMSIEIMDAFVFETRVQDCAVLNKAKKQKTSSLCVPHILKSSKLIPASDSGKTVAIFKSHLNDIPADICNRKQKIAEKDQEKSEKKVVSDLYNELISQIQECSRVDESSSVSYGDSIFFETLENQNPKLLAELGEPEEVVDLCCSFENNDVHLKAFPVETRSSKVKPTEEDNPTFDKNLTQKLSTKVSIISENLDQWLEDLNLRHLGSTFAKCGVRTKEDLLKPLNKLEYKEAMRFLEKCNVRQPGARDRIFLAMEKELGLFQKQLEEAISLKQNEKPPEITLFGCCSKGPLTIPDFVHPLPLRQWLGRQGLGYAHRNFSEAGYDDYEWILLQMCSAHPLNEAILERSLGLRNPATRARILYKLNEEAEEYCRLVLIPRFGLHVRYESVASTTACNCYIF